jgi:hypothetical protein
MKKNLTFFFLTSILLGSFFISSVFTPKAQAKTPDVFVGVDVAYENMTEIKNLINEISSYTNFFVIGCNAITRDKTKLEEICQYLYDKGSSFIIYQEWPLGYPFVSNWLETAKSRWGEHFLGIYYLDESGGRQLDLEPGWIVVRNPSDYTDAGNQFNRSISYSVNWFKGGYSNWTNLSLFMSDYNLYWFDYKAGYDGLFAQFGWNYSRQLNVALCRGAATVQNKEWGVMITHTYSEPPYIESGPELFNDMVLAYDNGAKYIIVFDSNVEWTQGILKNEHLDALKKFWQYIQNNPRKSNLTNERTAFILPEDYAYGFRGLTDKVWGIWEADNFAYQQSVNINNLLTTYGPALDIIYEDGLNSTNTGEYHQLIYWNTINTPSYPLPSPATPAPTQTSSPDPPSDYAQYTFYPTTLIFGAIIAVAALAFITRRKSLGRFSALSR